MVRPAWEGEEDDELAAGEHCHVGASVEMNRVVYDWLGDVLRRG